MDKYILRDYLEKVRLLESDILTMKETINHLHASKESVPPYMPPKKPDGINLPTPPSPLRLEDQPMPNLPSKKTTIGVTICMCLFCGPGMIPFAIGYVLWRNHKTKKAQAAYEIELQEYHIATAQAVAKHEAAQAQYEQSLKAYDEALSLQKSTYDYNYDQTIKQISRFNGHLQDQLETLLKNKSETETVLESLYDLRIVYPEYRSLVPVTMFCEYMDSGRRTQLEGINGMYDLYKQELLGNIIISELGAIKENLQTINYNLTNISKQLQGIQRNQMMLYQEVAKCTYLANKLARTTTEYIEHQEEHMSSITDQISNIKMSAEMAAFNTNVAARRTDALARIAEYEHGIRHSPY